jgi:Na+-transporting methylmalonyl-CoA/oxaloacetate decarboxylase gamma subunit
MSFTNIGIHNLLQPGFNALQFSLMGMGLVFGGLLIIALYILLLPRLLALGERKIKPRESKCTDDKCKREEEEILLAIATALHLHNDFPEGEDRITWKSHGDMESPWLVSGRMHSLKSRQQVNPWNTQ